MSTGAMIMMIFALLITWGGAAVCISIAMKASRRK
ncbi:MetS family NSS transporter small subunit [Shewanella schlegeliana]|uniref:MetS family NSS transporter small subunit n=1 Tax=Shewanella schlegeliana TaxID=190308 RepID=A0ABS1SYL9_9GAMM|nr:MetS family NSS transporter small subunit [Shewanella schlegeliana]MBL4913653.1 MetS family NSS transporter small subunit [Shewanella schlegeliana]